MIEALGGELRAAAVPAAETGETLAAARALMRAIPALADKLLARQSGRVHREIVTLIERALIAHVLDRLGGNQLRAARALGLNRNTLRKRCHDLGLLPIGSTTTAQRPAKIS